MATLNIGGKRVTVDDSFLKLSPADQQKAVDEIAQSMGMGAQKAGAPNTAMDMAKSALSGVRSGIEGMAGMMGDAREMQGNVAGWVAGKMGASPETQQTVNSVASRFSMLPFSPSTGTIRKGTDALVGDPYKPQTTAGEYAKTAGEFLPATLIPAGKAGVAERLVTQTLVPALASETAGQMTEGTAAEPYARAAGALGGGLAAAGVKAGVNALSNSSAQKAAQAAIPAASDLKATESQLFNAARQSGVYVKPQGVTRLADNMTLAAGRLNTTLRPKTAGVVEEIMAMRGKPADVQTIHELRQVVQGAMENADAQDVRTLNKMLTVLDGFIDNPNPQWINGTPDGFSTLRQAIDTSAKRFKTQEIEKLIDLADVKTGQYTQSGMMNALRQKSEALYKKIIDGRMKGFTPEEIAIIRGLAKTENTSAAMKLLAKLAPRGVVSMTGSVLLGSTFGGPIGAAIPVAAGGLAARGADQAAMGAAQNLRSLAATGRPLPAATASGAQALLPPAALDALIAAQRERRGQAALLPQK